MFGYYGSSRSRHKYLDSLPEVCVVFICWEKHLTAWIPPVIFPQLNDPSWYWQAGPVQICRERGCNARTVMAILFRPRTSEKGELFSENARVMESELRRKCNDPAMKLDRDTRNEFWDIAYKITIWDEVIVDLVRPIPRP